jgi:hypothetical protein
MIINGYPNIANRLNATFAVHTSSNETVMIGHGKHEVLNNNPEHKSHLIGNGGENIFVVSSDYETLDSSKLPIPEVVIYDVDKENLIDTLDLRQIKQQVVKDLNKEIKVKTSVNGTDILVELFYLSEDQQKGIVTVKLKNALVTNWYERLHVIIDNVPMKIEDFELKPLPLIFDETDKNIIVIGSNDVEEGNKIIVSREIGNYTFARSGDNLIITNAFDHDLANDKLCTISLSEFYKEKKMQTLLIKFADKEILLKNEMGKINSAASLKDLSYQYKDTTYADIFNKTVTKNPRKRRNVEGYEQVTSGASQKSPWIGGFITNVIGFGRNVISSFTKSFDEREAPAKDQNFGYVKEFDVNGTIFLMDVLIRKFITKVQYSSFQNEREDYSYNQVSAIEITEQLEKLLKKAAKKSGISFQSLNFDPIKTQRNIYNFLFSGRIDKISEEITEPLKNFPEKTVKRFTESFRLEFQSIKGAMIYNVTVPQRIITDSVDFSGRIIHGITSV